MSTETSTKDNKRDDDNPSSALESDDYDPHSHRDLTNGTSNFVTFIHMLKGIIGTGIFAMPRVFSLAGYVIGTIGGALIGTLLTYCIHILVRSQYILCKRHRRPALNYQTTMKMALEDGPSYFPHLAPYAHHIVNIFILINQLGTCAIYVIFTAQNLQAALSDWSVLNIREYIAILLPPFLGLVCIRNLKLLAPFSMVATIVTALGIILIFTYVFQEIPPLSGINAVGNLLDLPLFFGTTVFALVSIIIAITLEQNMKTPKTFVSTFGVINGAMGISTALFILLAFFGYLKYGETIHDTITLNLPQKDITTKMIQMLFAVSTFISIGLQFYVPFGIIWRWVSHPKSRCVSKYFKNDLWGELLVRIALALFIWLFAIAFQNLGVFISIIGALALSMLAVAFPAIIEICVMYPNFGKFQYILVIDVTLIIIGVLALITGVSSSISDLIREFK